MPGYANPQNLNRFSYVQNNPIRFSDPTGHICVEEGEGGEVLRANCKTGKIIKSEPKLPGPGSGGSGYCDGPNSSVICKPKKEPGLDLHLSPDLLVSPPVNTLPTYGDGLYGPPASPVDHFAEFWQSFEFGVEALDLLDLIEEGILLGKPVYKQVKYAFPLGAGEYVADGVLQLYDDRNKDLTVGQRVMRGLVRSGESALTDGASILGGGAAAGALQASVPIPLVSAGAGYVAGSYATSAIVDSFFVNNVNPYVFSRWLGGP